MPPAPPEHPWVSFYLSVALISPRRTARPGPDGRAWFDRLTTGRGRTERVEPGSRRRSEPAPPASGALRSVFIRVPHHNRIPRTVMQSASLQKNNILLFTRCQGSNGLEGEPFDWFDWFDSLRSLTTGRSPAPSKVEGLAHGRLSRRAALRVGGSAGLQVRLGRTLALPRAASHREGVRPADRKTLSIS